MWKVRNSFIPSTTVYGVSTICSTVYALGPNRNQGIQDSPPHRPQDVSTLSHLVSTHSKRAQPKIDFHPSVSNSVTPTPRASPCHAQSGSLEVDLLTSHCPPPTWRPERRLPMEVRIHPGVPPGNRADRPAPTLLRGGSGKGGQALVTREETLVREESDKNVPRVGALREKSRPTVFPSRTTQTPGHLKSQLCRGGHWCPESRAHRAQTLLWV